MFGSICNEKSIGGVSSIIICGQSVLSGMWFPVDTLSGGIKKVMEALPFRNAHLLIQNAELGIENAFNDFILPLIIVLAYTVVAFTFATVIFKKNMKA